MTDSQDLLKGLKDFEKTPESRGHDLRLDLAEIILRHLDEKKWAQNKLGEATGMKPSYLTRLIHSSTNCTFDTAGRIFFALGIKAKLVEVKDCPDTSNWTVYSSANTLAPPPYYQTIDNG